jgi:hypothetical protein
MSKIPRFAAYAAAFEQCVATNDWSLLEPFFTEDAVYDIPAAKPLGGHIEGRDALLAWFEEILDRFDRRFDSREVALLEGPKQTGDSVWIRGTATYRAAGVPPLVLELEETATFEGDRIRLLEDRYEPAMEKTVAEYLKAHGDKLGIAAD